MKGVIAFELGVNKERPLLDRRGSSPRSDPKNHVLNRTLQRRVCKDQFDPMEGDIC